MPATYAHYYFGNQCYGTLPNNLKEIVDKYRSLYDLGVHGPDILFYDLIKNETTKVGYGMHKEAASNFFEKAKMVLNSSKENHDARLVYILGFLTHFAFDSSAHGYVERKREEANLTHNRVETDYERHILLLDGKNPTKYNRASKLKVNKFSAKIIADFYPLSDKQVYRSLKMQKTIVTLLDKKSDLDRKLKKKYLRKNGLSAYADLIIEEEELDACLDSNIRLDKCRKRALDFYPKLLENLLGFIDNKNKLSKYFDRTFDKLPDYKNIPILPLEEELKYEIESFNI